MSVPVKWPTQPSGSVKKRMAMKLGALSPRPTELGVFDETDPAEPRFVSEDRAAVAAELRDRPTCASSGGRRPSRSRPVGHAGACDRRLSRRPFDRLMENGFKTVDVVRCGDPAFLRDFDWGVACHRRIDRGPTSGSVLFPDGRKVAAQNGSRATALDYFGGELLAGRGDRDRSTPTTMRSCRDVEGWQLTAVGTGGFVADENLLSPASNRFRRAVGHGTVYAPALEIPLSASPVCAAGLC